jgi:hypothetical protein
MIYSMMDYLNTLVLDNSRNIAKLNLKKTKQIKNKLKQKAT